MSLITTTMDLLWSITSRNASIVGRAYFRLYTHAQEQDARVLWTCCPVEVTFYVVRNGWKKAQAGRVPLTLNSGLRGTSSSISHSSLRQSRFPFLSGFGSATLSLAFSSTAQPCFSSLLGVHVATLRQVDL